MPPSACSPTPIGWSARVGEGVGQIVDDDLSDPIRVGDHGYSLAPRPVQAYGARGGGLAMLLHGLVDNGREVTGLQTQLQPVPLDA